jgi:lysophospholipase L1-like esterase
MDPTPSAIPPDELAAVEPTPTDDLALPTRTPEPTATATPEPTPTRVPELSVIFDGDSLTSGGEDRTGTYPALTVALLAAQGVPVDIVTNLGAPGQTTAQMAADAAEQVDSLFQASIPDQLVVAWAGTNDIAFSEPGNPFERLAAYSQARRAAGFKVIVLTMLPRERGSNEDKRVAFNERVRAEWATFADALVDVAADPRIGDLGDEADKTYYVGDLTHLNDVGNGVVAELVAKGVESVLDTP